MSRDSASLLDIVRAGQLVLQFAQGLNREQLASDVLRQSAILYQISIMGRQRNDYLASFARSIRSALG
jgi:uncharacterized protein with HEPN domain